MSNISNRAAVYRVTSDRQAVIDAMTGIVPRDQWKTLPTYVKALLTVVVVHRDQEKYCDAKGFLTMNLTALFRELFGISHDYEANHIRGILASKKMRRTNGKQSIHQRVRFLVTPDVWDCLQDLERHEKLIKQLASEQSGVQELADQIMAEFGEDGAAALIYALRRRMKSSVPCG